MTEAALKFDQSRPDIPAAAVVEAADTGRLIWPDRHPGKSLS
jgi:hypothetical protein